MTKKQKEAAEAMNAEARIKEAARKLFTEKGYDAVKTRDIAAEAGINIALLNYYFRSKEKLFDLIMMENMMAFFETIGALFSAKDITHEQKIGLLVEAYIDNLLKNPNLPVFILNESRKNPKRIMEMIKASKITHARDKFLEETAASANNKNNLHSFHLMANMMGFIVFPFAAAPMLQMITGVNEKQFRELMQERKALIPKWIKKINRPE